MTQVEPIFYMDPLDDPMDIDVKPYKKVHFCETIEVRYTYSREIYDRSVIDSTIVLRNRRQVNDFEWRKLFIELNQFKLYEMQVHPDSKQNTNISRIPSIQIPVFRRN